MNPSCSSKSGYILPDGSFFGCNYSQHRLLGEAIFKQILKKDVPEDAQIEGDNLGWLRLQRDAKDTMTGFLMGTGKKPTNKQLSTLVDYCERHKCLFPQELLDN